MKKNIYLIAGFILMSFVLTSASVYAADSKIGFVNLQEIIRNTKAGKKAGEEFKKLYDKEHEGIAASENELKNSRTN
jgi:outer membrane protein